MGKRAVSSTEKRKRATPLPKECPSCSALKPVGVRKCLACGFEPERQSPIEEHDGNLVQLNGRRKAKAEATPHDKQDFWSMCLWHAQAKGWKAGAASHRYRDRFGVWPRGLRDDPVAPDADFERWITVQNIRAAKARQKRQRAVAQESSHAA